MSIGRSCGCFYRRKITAILVLLTILVCSNFYLLSSSGKHLSMVKRENEQILALKNLQDKLKETLVIENSTTKAKTDEQIGNEDKFQNRLLSTGKNLDELIHHLKEETNLQIEKEEYSEKTTKEIRQDMMQTLLQNLMKTLTELQQNMKRITGNTKSSPSVKDESNPCPELSLTGKSEEENHPSSCKPHQPPKEACEFAKSLFYIDPNLQKCPEENIELCKINILLSGNGKYKLKISCDFSYCRDDDEIIVSIADPKSGDFLEYPFSSGQKVRNSLSYIIKKTYNSGFNFVFLSCRSVAKRKQHIHQLITFPHFPSLAPHIKPQTKININIVLLDSVSRAHFFRSLPKTISTLRNIETNAKVPARAFDFELYQAIHGHTAENMHVLFSGHLFPPYYTSKMREESNTRADIFFNTFKAVGYQTVYQEDLCWKAVWGMMLEFGASSWEELMPKLKESGVDNIGLTLASCEIFARNHIETPFNGPDGDQLCYNGKFHHIYYFEHLKQLLKSHNTQNNSAPLLAFTATQVGHDYTARRIQTADTALSEFFHNMAYDEDTLTILFSDHGNTYSSYLIESLEGRFEMFHPAMFMIVPDTVAAKLGQDVVKALEQNQHRLLTLMDINNALMPLVNFTMSGYLDPRGVFAPLPMNRTCDSIQLSTPNICVCEGWDTAVQNDTSQIPFAEFAFGQLNAMLQRQYRASGNKSSYGFGACEKLVVQGIENVRRRTSADGSLITTLDVAAKSRKLRNQKDVFQVQIKSTTDPHGDSSKFEMLSYNRISQYGIYRKCADPGIDLKLCICNKRHTAKRKQPHPKKWLLHLFDRHVLGDMKVVADVEKCVILLLRNHTKVINGDVYSVLVYEVTNICPRYKFKIRFDGTTTNMKLSNELPVETEINVWEIKFLTVAYPHVTYWSYEFFPLIDSIQKTLV